MTKLPKKIRRVELRAPRADVALWIDIAQVEKMTLSDWIRRTLNTAITTVKEAK